jgi:succinoglycan biosynthesis transport protein ExoP
MALKSTERPRGRARRRKAAPRARATLSNSSQIQPIPHDAHERPALERGLAIARRNWILLLICFITVPLIALVYSLVQTPEYTASASLLFSTSEAGLSNSPVLTETDPQRAAATNLRLVSLEQVAARTAKALDNPSMTTEEVSNAVSVSPQGESDLIAVEATDQSPQAAATIANEFARQYITFRKEADQEKIARAQAIVRGRFEELTPAERAGPEGENLEQRERQLTILSTLQTGNTELVQAATAPDSPSSPKTSRNVALGILLGVLLGACLALLREQFDRRLKDLEDVEEMFDLPILGTIPQSSAIQHSGPDTELAPTGIEGEAFRMLRASLRYFNIDKEITAILITSAAPEDGKTTVAWNVALATARAGERVLYLETDLRRPGLAGQLGIQTDQGLSSLLVGDGEPASAIRNVKGVDVLFAGPLPPNPAELIESKRMSELLSWSEGEYDRVIVDSPPSAIVADAVPLFNQVGGVVVVVRLRKSPREAAEHLREQLSHTGAPVLGVVVNGVATPATSGYYRSSSTVPATSSDAPAAPNRASKPQSTASSQRAG